MQRAVQRSTKLANPPFLDFFAGSGLVTEALKGHFQPAWANDISEQKATVYRANHGGNEFHLGDVSRVNGRHLPKASLSWASFPCQDLSLAGKLGGIDAARSGLVWHWLRTSDEMESRPPILVAENVAGLISADKGAHYRALHAALVARGYQAGPLVLDAVHWLPQSRPRVFVVAVLENVDVSGLTLPEPSWMHTRVLQAAGQGLSNFRWWSLPEPRRRTTSLSDLIEFDAPRDAPSKAARNLQLIPKRHLEELRDRVKKGLRVAPGYKRTRPVGQVLELRFDGIAGCIRTPEGGSSRQHLILPKRGRFDTRLLTVREAARLMGAPEHYIIPGTYNQGYSAMGDAVAVPAVRFLAQHLLAPLVRRAHGRA